MLSINTNLSSLIAQNSLTQSTSKLNQAIERMSTGFKINHASDNAANYSISTNMTTKMSAYMVAEDNTAMGLDLVTTASEIISQMENKAERLRALSIQASNGTYGAQSMNAIQSEASALMSEITRLYLSSEYNGISLFDRQAFIMPENLVKAGESGFIDESTPINLEPQYDGFIVNPKTYEDSVVDAMTSIDSFTDGASGEFKIEDANDLAKLATIVNDNNWDTSNATFFLANDIDLTQWCATYGNWIPIGIDDAHCYKGTFDGNGHVISGLTINNPTAESQGLFGRLGASTIKNIGLENVMIIGESYTGALIGYAAYSATAYISNCFSTGKVISTGGVYTGGLIGGSNSGEIINCYSMCDVSGNNEVGGLAGSSSSSITNSYATGSVTGSGYVGGLTGNSNSSITNSYATGSVTGSGNYVGGLVGYSYSSSSITNSYATGNVNGINYVGGLVGYSYYSSSSITNSYATGDVNGINYVGGLVGHSYSSSSSVTNSYATGDVSGNEWVGGLVGKIYKTFGTVTISSSYSSGEVTGTSKIGSFIGGVVNTTNGTSFGTVNISDCYAVDNGMDLISGCYTRGGSSPNYTYTANTNGYDAMIAGITAIKKQDTSTNLQIGINGNDNSRLNFNTNFQYDLSALEADIGSDSALNTIDEFIKTLSAKQTELGAVQNRLESALDEIAIQYDNLASSRSTLRDADMAELSSEYIKMQILQEASATLLATANQSPSIALQLI